MVLTLKYLLYTVSILSSILLICIIMIQQNKAGGGLGAVSGGTAENIFGTSAGNVLTKATTWLAVIFLASTLLLGTVIGRMAKGNVSVSEQLLQETVEVEAPAPEAKADDTAKAVEATAPEAKADEAAKPAEEPAK